MDKLKMHSPNLTDANLARLRELFPGCVTEAKAEDGSVKLAVDFDQLRQELSNSLVEGPQERYHLNWPGKREALLTANAPIAKTLRPAREESVAFDLTKNLFIEGDNLEALKLLQETYLAKIKMIFIDPPYNTGGDFLYQDDFAESADEYLRRSNQIDEEGNRLFSNSTSNGRFHSDWLSMMYPRLKLARNLLSDDGAIFVSIDFNEAENLKKIMDEIFGEENFQRAIVWRIGWLSGYKTTAPNFIRNHDSILFYSKNSEKLNFIKKYIDNANFKPLVKKEPKLKEKLTELGLDNDRQERLFRFINHENRPDRYPLEDTWNCNEYDDMNSIAIVSYSGEKISKILGINEEFKGQKSIKMLMRILESVTEGDDIVLDFFAGTSSTAHAVMQLNANDGGSRRFIMAQLPEPCVDDSEALKAGYSTIADLSKERIRRIGRKIGEGSPNLDVGFRVLKIDTSNMADVYYTPDLVSQGDLLDTVDNIKPDRTPEDLLLQVMLDWGVDLALPIEKKVIQGKDVYFVDTDALAACFDKTGGVDDAFAKELAAHKPLRAVFRDAGFKSDDVKINIEQIFKLLSPGTEVKTLEALAMKLKFKTQAYQTAAVQAVVDCFKGQPPASPEAISYRIDPGKQAKGQTIGTTLGGGDGFRNADLFLSEKQLLENIQQVQRSQNLPVSDKLVKTKVSDINLDVEMETGTGKTYCYIKTLFELNKQYGWSKFIIVVPSIAIREGVAKSLQITADHLLETYHKKARFFIYDSKQLHQLESFSSDAGINVMIINVQAFNATGKDNRRIYEVLDEFQSRKPIDVISANRPILILDEPQKMEGGKTLDSLVNFKPLAVLRYSATHKTTHNRIHRLDALDAYNQKLVKKIAVRGITMKGLAGTNAYLYLQSIEISPKKTPEARVEFELKLKSGSIKRIVRKLRKGDNLFDLSDGLDQYRDGYVVSDVNAVTDTLSFTNGVELTAGDAIGDVNEAALRRIQIRETIKAHFDKEQVLFQQGIKVLSLFFIDEVMKYRDYGQRDEKGDYARIFEEEYKLYLNEVLELEDTPWTKYLKSIAVENTHSGYFSIDKRSKHLIDPDEEKRGENAGMSNDADAYDLILKDKERLLSLSEPVRFIFSHSALREGWDNPNVFVICTLKHSDNTISRRQEVGRGLRLSVDQQGERMDSPATAHEINVLTVVASESYKDFVAALQADISASLSARPKIADKAYFTGKVLKVPSGDVTVTADMATDIEFYLIQNGYVDKKRNITEKYHLAKKEGALVQLPEELLPHADQVFQLIDSVFTEGQIPTPENGRNLKQLLPNQNFEKQGFKALWQRINRKAAYSVHFNGEELVRKAVDKINHKDEGLRVTPLQYVIQAGEQEDEITYDKLEGGKGFRISQNKTENHRSSIHSAVAYDLIGKIAEGTQLTRRTVAEIIKGMNVAVFAQFRTNPESFITEAVRLINEQKATVIVEHLAYDPVDDSFDLDIFTAGQTKQDLSKAGDKLQHHIYDYVLTDSNIERQFVKELDTSTDVVVYAKLPKGFFIPTPVGNYNPDWAISFKEGQVKHIYFVAETKGSMSSMELREIEKTKITCARKFFSDMNERFASNNVQYDVVDSFGKLMEVVK